MPQYQDYPAVVSLDGTEDVLVLVDPTGSPISKRATTAQIAGLASGAQLVATLVGSVTGHAYVWQLANNATYKRWLVNFVGWNDAGRTYTWASAFATYQNLIQNSSPPCSTSSTTGLVIPAGAIGNGVVEAIGA